MRRGQVEQIESIVKSVVEKLAPGATAHACGSYRRGKLQSGDVVHIWLSLLIVPCCLILAVTEIANFRHIVVVVSPLVILLSVSSH